MINKCILYTLLFVASLLAMYGCKPSGENSYAINSGSDMKDFFDKESKKNTYETRIKDVGFKLKYISNEQMALQQIQDISNVTQSKFDSLVKDYDSLLFFNLQIDIDNFNDELLKYKLGENMDAEYNQRVDYYSFGMQKDINIVLYEKDTVPCVLYHFERNYGISPKNNFMLGFKVSSLKNAVLVYDNKFLKTGTIKFALKEEEILNHPHIKFN